VCARRTTLKSGSLHFAAEGPSSSSKVAMRELDRRANELKKISGTPMYNKEEIKTYSNLMRLVDLIFLHLSW
jgi:hypothetical protein